jgi:hypothetical protein
MGDDFAKIPTYDRLMDPLFKAIRALGGSGAHSRRRCIYDRIFSSHAVVIHHFTTDRHPVIVLRRAWRVHWVYLKPLPFCSVLGDSSIVPLEASRCVTQRGWQCG